MQAKDAGHASVMNVNNNRRREQTRYEFSVAMLSVTRPAGYTGSYKRCWRMNVYIHELARELGHSRLHRYLHSSKKRIYAPHRSLSPHVRVIHIKAGPKPL